MTQVKSNSTPYSFGFPSQTVTTRPLMVDGFQSPTALEGAIDSAVPLSQYPGSLVDRNEPLYKTLTQFSDNNNASQKAKHRDYKQARSCRPLQPRDGAAEPKAKKRINFSNVPSLTEPDDESTEDFSADIIPMPYRDVLTFMSGSS